MNQKRKHLVTKRRLFKTSGYACAMAGINSQVHMVILSGKFLWERIKLFKTGQFEINNINLLINSLVAGLINNT